ncbi:ABC transporter permease [Rhodovastum atsumiense]|uniref:ABC transporter permease n=1 Tax=Rhodovastum atsumiense TaxID=504468 RepID=A0A5M6IME6_9PROT|nr:ABC transporter permease [Rhodovastum atsumiense]
MLRILARRVVQAVLVALIVASLCFLLMRLLPGDLAFRIAAGRYGYDLVDAASAASVRAELGLDRPVLLQFALWIADVFTFDLGNSMISGGRVAVEVSVQMTYTVLLATAAVLVAMLPGPGFGLLCGLRPGGLADRAGLALAAVLRAVPGFVVGLMLMVVFAARLGWLPAAGFAEPATLILPAVSLGLCLAAISARIARDATVACMASPAVAFAREKGLSLPQTVWQHVIRNAAVPVITHLGVQAVLLVEGVVVIETLFSWPGVGHALVHGVLGRDIPVVQGMALALGLLVVGLNTMVDMLVLAIDPRRRGA